ncbi:MAG TPA: SH3 domain-containing protein, partial [Dongiaceae bacterium]
GLFGCLFQAPLLAWAAALVFLIAAANPAQAQSEKQPLPRFASLDSSAVNLRAGPGETYPKLWLYQRNGMPVEIIEEFDVWRRVRDYQGVVGWVKSTLLSSRRSAIVTESRRALHEDPLETSRIVAYADPGVVAKLLSCDGQWCRLDVKGYKGWLPRSQFWGAYPDENFKE